MSLRVASISLLQYKNYDQASFRFTERVVGICGRNGKGKTNLLDAIHYLCFTKSYFTRNDQLVVQHGEKGFRVEGEFVLKGKVEKPVCVLRETGKKEFMVNEEAYPRFSSHIGRYPLVVVAPDDVALVIGGSEDRRRFIDMILSQLDQDYIKSLIKYNKILLQRNSFLRHYSDSFEQRDLSVLDVLDEQLSTEGDTIYAKRQAFLDKFLPAAALLYQDIARQKEKVRMEYESDLQQNPMRELLRFNRQRDMNIQRTTAGIHKDDLLFYIGAESFKNIASQGQRKSLLFALKLCEVETIKETKRISPLLLLDDVFEKLDDERIGNLLMRVVADPEAQVFITDTSCERLRVQLEKLQQPFQLIHLIHE
jgi:DNA replication and repair protein RecF